MAGIIAALKRFIDLLIRLSADHTQGRAVPCVKGRGTGLPEPPQKQLLPGIVILIAISPVHEIFVRTLLIIGP